MCPIYEPEGQGRGSTFRVCHTLKKMAISLHTEALVDSQMATTAQAKHHQNQNRQNRG